MKSKTWKMMLVTLGSICLILCMQFGVSAKSKNAPIPKSMRGTAYLTGGWTQGIDNQKSTWNKHSIFVLPSTKIDSIQQGLVYKLSHGKKVGKSYYCTITNFENPKRLKVKIIHKKLSGKSSLVIIPKYSAWPGKLSNKKIKGIKHSSNQGSAKEPYNFKKARGYMSFQK